MTDLATAPEARVGPLLRQWRQRRRLSQLDLALDAGVSARHLSFVETGRSKPSAQMVLHLAQQLEVPLRERNAMLLAAGYAPAYDERALDAPDMTPVRAALQLVLDGHDPHPGLVVDRRWNLVAANRGLGVLLDGVAPALLEPPANCLRIALHPDGLAPKIANHAEWRAHLLARLERQVAMSGDDGLEELLAELGSYPAPRPLDEAAAARSGEPSGRRGSRPIGRARMASGRPCRERGNAAGPPPAHDIFVPFRIRDGRLDVRHGRRHHRRRALDRVVLPGRRVHRGRHAAPRRGRRLTAAHPYLGGN
jgi:transcriptional regulator with XRE-family HTH domain